MKFKATTIDKDLGRKRILSVFKKIKNAYVDVGYFGEEKHEGSEYTIPQIAAVHEFGTKDGKIPERSFLRKSFDEKQNERQKSLDDGMSNVIEGKTDMISALAVVGELAASDARKKIKEGDSSWPGHAESTKKKRGESAKLLWDTGQMINYCGHRIVVDGDEKKSKRG